jgi:hypothetical protein
MNRRAPYVITFAGVPGTSKTIISYHLSMTIGLPIFSTDNLRYEVREDLRVANANLPEARLEYERRYNERWSAALQARVPFIRDGSVDRQWIPVKKELQAAGFGWFLIDMELSRSFMRELYLATGRPGAARELDSYVTQHESFMARHGADISIQIGDQDFPRRRELAEGAVREYLSETVPVARVATDAG